MPARNGDIPRSREVATFTVLMTAGAGLWMLGGGLVNKLNRDGARPVARPRADLQPNVLIERIGADIAGVMLACLPLALAIMLVALAVAAADRRLEFQRQGLHAELRQAQSDQWLGNMVSTNALVELLKAIAKTLLVGAVAWYVVMSEKDAVIGLAVEPLGAAGAPGRPDGQAFLIIVGSLGAIALLDGLTRCGTTPTS
jgi:flagellar biosynthetic protein FlhB